jgi:hypothetical protein
MTRSPPNTLSGATGTIAESNVNDSRQNGEPNHADAYGGVSVWHRWTAPSSGRVTFETTGSSIDTLLAIYRGDVLTSLNSVGHNDDCEAYVDDAMTTSCVTFNAVSGSVYRIAIDGYNYDEGDIQLSWGPVSRCTLTGTAGSDVLNRNRRCRRCVRAWR